MMDIRKILIVLIVVSAGLLLNPYLALSEEEHNHDHGHENEHEFESGGMGGNDSELEDLNRQIAEKRKKVEQLEKSISQVKKDIRSTKLKTTSYKNLLAILNNREAKVKLDIEATSKKIDTLELEIQAFELEIQKKEENIDRQKTIIAEFIRTLHYENDKSYLEVLSAYENFSDFYNRLQYLEKIEGDLGKNAKSIRLAKVDLEEKKEQSVERQDSYKQLKSDLDNKKQDLDDQIDTKANLLRQTQSSERTFQALLRNLRAQYRQIETEIQSIEAQVRKRLEAQNKLGKNVSSGNFVWPAQSRYITATYHDPGYPYRHVFEHSGIDIRAAQGTPIRATGSGFVGRARRCSSHRCYSYILLIHANGLSSLYGHMSKIIVKPDQFVTTGDIIGYSGGTPRTPGAGPFVTGPHLHFEIRKGGIPVNPCSYVKCNL